MADAFLVNLNEMEYKETQNAEGQIKALITDTQMTISKKGTNQFSINSYHHFIITTNKENPIGTTKDDRRKLIIRSSDEFIGNREYFNKMYALLENVEFIRTCYDYFKDYDLSGYEYKDIPKTEHQEDLQMLSVSVPNMLKKHFKLGCLVEF
jgi:CRISPR/Cas system endoribonuclease Cas6 (RAMP superfamily)